MPQSPTVVSLLCLDPQKIGTMEEYTLSLSEALDRRGWRSVTVFLRLPGEPLATHFREAKTTLEAVAHTGGIGLYRDVFRILRKYRPEVVHFHFFSLFSLMPVVARLAGAKFVVFTEHIRLPEQLSLWSRLKMRLWDRVVLRVLQTKILAVSEHILRTLADCYQMTARRIGVLYNGVNTRRFVPLASSERAAVRRELGLAEEHAVIVSAAYLIPEKGIGDLLVAAQKMSEQQPKARFVVAGDGPLRASLQQQCRDLGIEQRVLFAGLRSDVHRLMAMADVVVVPSVWQDPAPLVVLEAMATARPVVATRVGGIPELLVDQETGILVPPNSPEALAEALLRLLSKPEEAACMGRAGRARVEERFTMDRWVQDTVAIYQPAMDGQAAG